MRKLLLPPRGAEKERRVLTTNGQVTIIGGTGVGKSLFLDHLSGNCQKKVTLSLVGENFEPTGLTWIEEKLNTLLPEEEESEVAKEVTKIWADIFPGSSIERNPQTGEIIGFHTPNGDDIIGIGKLSRGEKGMLYYLVNIMLAPRHSMIFADSPTLFLHPQMSGRFWEMMEEKRSDCRFIYVTNDPVFMASRNRNTVIWIRNYRPQLRSWDYEILDKESVPSEDLFLELMGNRHPVLFVEGDSTHSLDMKLYEKVFPEFTVRPLGSCNKVIESTRTFKSINYLHHIECHGLVDRDRRTPQETSYLRDKGVMVPMVAEIENIFLAEGVVRHMAGVRSRNPENVLQKLKSEVTREFLRQLDQQALQHTRHRMKRDVEKKIDARFTCITALELHIKGLIYKLQPREHYRRLVNEFREMTETGDYAGILRVFNFKPMLGESSLPHMLGYSGPDNYIDAVMKELEGDGDGAKKLREEIRQLLCVGPDQEKISRKEPYGKKEQSQMQTPPRKRKPYRKREGGETEAPTGPDSFRRRRKKRK